MSDWGQECEDAIAERNMLIIEQARLRDALTKAQSQITCLRGLLREAYDHLDTHEPLCPLCEGYGEPCRCELPALRRRIEEALKDGDA